MPVQNEQLISMCFCEFMEDQLGGNVKSCSVVTKQCERILIDLKVFEEVK